MDALKLSAAVAVRARLGALWTRNNQATAGTRRRLAEHMEFRNTR
jgi:hypothetical protein